MLTALVFFAACFIACLFGYAVGSIFVHAIYRHDGGKLTSSKRLKLISRP